MLSRAAGCGVYPSLPSFTAAGCFALPLQKSLKVGLLVVGGLNLGGSINPVFNAVSVVELAVEKGATVILMPVSSRKQLF